MENYVTGKLLKVKNFKIFQICNNSALADDFLKIKKILDLLFQR